MGIPNQAYGHFFMVLEEALGGRGVALVPRMLAAGDIESGRLVVPLEIEHESAGSYYLLCREHQADASTVQTFREWLFAQRDATLAAEVEPEPACVLDEEIHDL
jgi:LysR family glycine cleavage system transcriptional activator